MQALPMCTHVSPVGIRNISAKMTTVVPKDTEKVSAGGGGGDNDAPPPVGSNNAAGPPKAHDQSDCTPKALPIEEKFKYALQFYKKSKSVAIR